MLPVTVGSETVNSVAVTVVASVVEGSDEDLSFVVVVVVKSVFIVSTVFFVVVAFDDEEYVVTGSDLEFFVVVGPGVLVSVGRWAFL